MLHLPSFKLVVIPKSSHQILDNISTATLRQIARPQNKASSNQDRVSPSPGARNSLPSESLLVIDELV